MKDEKQIHRWLNGEMTAQELEAFKATQDYTDYSAIAEYAADLEAPAVNKDEALADLKKRLADREKNKVIKPNFKGFYQAAAILIVLVVSSYFIFFNQSTTVKTKIAETTTTLLPDNSEVVLNAQSKIAYNEKKWKEQRELTLEGEAFFKVTKGSDFEVRTSAGEINVLGTQFNVKNRLNYFEVECYEGRVAVTYNNEEIILTRGNKYRVVNGRAEKIEGLLGSQPSWMMHESSFVAVPLEQVIAEIERQYDLTINASKVDTSALFTGSFTHDDKNIALQSVTIPLGLSYKIDGDKVELYNYEGE
ncbi:FecR family protein [Leeuwenhoekiella sp. A2]|uniref:FecR family protein n=1 Tax=Leeuwenhoekiella sp. A2 TaxID=3141460 RepID=UPI003A7FDCC8